MKKKLIFSGILIIIMVIPIIIGIIIYKPPTVNGQPSSTLDTAINPFNSTEFYKVSDYYSLSCQQLEYLENYYVISYLQSPQSWEPTIITFINQIIIGKGCI